MIVQTTSLPVTHDKQLQNAAIVTLLALGHASLGHINIDRAQALADVDLVISFLREGETRWRWSGRQAYVVFCLSGTISYASQ